MKREHVHTFKKFLLLEQDVELEDDGPVEAGEGEEGQPKPKVQRLKIAFVPANKEGNPVYRNKEVEFPVYAIYYNEVKEWVDKFVPKSKREDFINILKIKHDVDTLEEKQLVLDFMKEVKEQRLGDRTGEITVEFSSKREPITEKLDVTLIYYDVKRKDD